MTIEPHWVNCSGGTRAIDTNACDLELYDLTTTGAVAGTYGVTVGIACDEAPEYIQMTHPGGCSMRIFAQTDLKGAHLTDEGNGHLRLHGTIEGITATTPNCFDLHTSEAQLHIDVTVEGLNEEGGATELSISDDAA